MLSDLVGERITMWRKSRKWNRERLAQECAKLGMPKLTAAVLTNIESGRRQQGARRRLINIDELVVIGEALRVPLALLLSPYPDKSDVEILPGRKVASWDVVRWLSGDLRLVKGRFTEIDSEADEPVRLLRKHDDLVSERLEAGRLWMDQLQDALRTARAEEAKGVPVRKEDVNLETLRKVVIAQAVYDTDKPIVLVRDSFRERQWPVPTLPDSLAYLRDLTVADLEASFAFYRKPIALHMKEYGDYLEMVLNIRKSDEFREDLERHSFSIDELRTPSRC